MAFEYKVAGKTVSLPVDDTVFAVRFQEPATPTVRAAGATRLGVGSFEDRIELPGEKFTIFARPRALPGVASMAADVRQAAGVSRTAPVFRVGTKHVVATDRVVVGFKEGVSDEQARQFLSRRGYTVLEKIERAYVVRLDESTDPFAEVAKLDGIDRIAFAEPDFVTVGRHLPRSGTGAPGSPGPMRAARMPSAANVVNDPLLDRQYAMSIIKADAAWKAIGSLSTTVKIAIIDEGVDRLHEDLDVVGEYDATGDDLDQQPNAWDGHGTACAGLAAAKANNNVGIRGVASGFPILAVRIALSNFPDGPWVTANTTIARGIEWAWKSGADVLSNSWGGGAPSSLIAQAFENARTKGRNGKGCVIAIAAGNENSPIRFPATLANLMVVTASNEFDEPKTPQSRDGEKWGSSYGDESWVAAPGVHNYTTDITADGGYSQGGSDPQRRPYNANYTPNFNGTSSATPIVAGAAALLLSLDGSMGEQRVREIIRDAADKVGAEYDANGHNPRMGFGRLNVERAVALVKADKASGISEPKGNPTSSGRHAVAKK